MFFWPAGKAQAGTKGKVGQRKQPWCARPGAHAARAPGVATQAPASKAVRRTVRRVTRVGSSGVEVCILTILGVNQTLKRASTTGACEGKAEAPLRRSRVSPVTWATSSVRPTAEAPALSDCSRSARSAGRTSPRPVAFPDGPRGRFVVPARPIVEASGTWHDGVNAGRVPVRILVLTIGAEGVDNTVRP